MLPAPAGAVDEKHIGALGLAEADTVEVGPDIVAGVFDIGFQHLPQLLQPGVALVLVSAYQGVHRQHILAVVVAQPCLLPHPVPEPGIVDNAVAAHQARQIEGLAGGVHGHGTHSGILADGLGGDMLVARKNQIRPDFVGNDVNIILFIQLHGLFQLPPLPYTATGVVRGAENGGMDFIFLDFPLHILVVHAPDAVLVNLQRGVDNTIAVVLQCVGEADVGGGVNQHIVPPGAQHIQGADHAAQYAVGIGDVLRGHGNAVVGFVPAEDGIKILLPGAEIAIGRMLGPLDDGLGHRGHRGEIHIRHPHGNQIEALPAGAVGAEHGVPRSIHRNGIHSLPVQDGSKIIFHGKPS